RESFRRTRGRSGPWALRPDVGHLAHRLTKLGEPVVLVLSDQAYAPRQRVRSGPGDAGVDQGVEHLALGLPEPGHRGGGQMGEQLLVVADPHPPADRALVASLSLARDRHPLLPGLL